MLSVQYLRDNRGASRALRLFHDVLNVGFHRRLRNAQR